MLTTSGSKQLLIGKKISRTSGATAKDPSASNYAVDGETVVVSLDGTVLTTSTVVNYDKIRIMQSQGSTKPAIYSDVIERKKVTAYKAKVATSAVEQVSYIGYDGTTSTLKIDVINNNQYIGRILMQGEQNTFGNRDMYKQFEYQSDASATQFEIGSGLQASLVANFKKHPDRYAVFELTNAGARTAVPTGAGTITFTYNSNQVVFNTDITDATGTAALAVGDFITVAAATTTAVYRVTAINTGTNTATIHIPYQGATATIANATAKFILSATALAANFGVKITGVAKTFSPGKFRYYKNRFKIQLTDAGVTDITYTTGAAEGNGTTEQIQELEWLLQDGNMYRVSVPPFVQRANAATYLAAGSGTGFSQVSLKFYDQGFGGVGMTEASVKEVVVAAVTTTNGSAGGCGTNMAGAASSVMEVLDKWLYDGTGAPGFPTQLSIV